MKSCENKKRGEFIFCSERKEEKEEKLKSFFLNKNKINSFSKESTKKQFDF